MAHAIVFVIDDEQDNLDYIEAILNEAEYGVQTFTSGAVALEKMKKTPPDMVLLDVQMPGMNGFQVLKAMQTDEELKTIPVVFLSAIGAITGIEYDSAEVESRYGVRPNDFIPKPIDPDKIIAKIKKLINKGI